MKTKKSGFTLIEMLVAVFVFSIIMTIAIGAIFSIVNANKTAFALKSVMDNLNSAIDTMSREARYGTVYSCGNDSPDFIHPANCDGSEVFAFVAKSQDPDNPLEGDHVIYKFEEDSSGDGTGGIYRCLEDTSPTSCTRLTASEVHITNLKFYVRGVEATEEYAQPLLLITISGYATAVGNNTKDFNIETMVSQRNLMCKQSMRSMGMCI